MEIRLLTDNDMTRAMELKVACWTEELAGVAENTLTVEGQTKLWTEWKNTPDQHNDIRYLIGAFDGGEMLGVAFASYIDSKDAPEEGIELNGLWVFPQHRGRGISLKLILDVLNFFLPLGSDKLVIYNHHGAPSNAFYKKFGGVVADSEFQMDGKLPVDIFEFNMSDLKVRLEQTLSRYQS